MSQVRTGFFFVLLNTRLISPFLHTKAQAVARLELP